MKRKSTKKKVTKRVVSKKDITVRKNRQAFPLFNLLVTVMLWLAVVVFFYSGRLMRPQTLVLGQQAPETIVASVDFDAETISATQLKQSEQFKQVPPVFTIDRTGTDQASQALNKLLPYLEALRASTDPERHALVHTSITDLLDLIPISLSPEELLRIVPDKTDDLQTIISSTLSTPIDTGMISEADLATQFSGHSAGNNVIVKGGTTETIRPLNSFLLQPVTVESVIETILKQLPRENRDEEVLRTLITPWLHANVIYDSVETATRREQAVKLVEPVIEQVAKGSILVRTGDPVSGQTLTWLTAHEKRLSELETPLEQIQRLIGSGFLLLIGLGLTVASAKIVQHSLLRSRRKVLLLLTISALPLVLAKLLLYLSVNIQILSPAALNYAVPLAIAPVLASILIGSIPGLLVGFWISFAMAALLGNSFEVFVLGLLITVTAVYTTRDVKRRAMLFRAGLWIGVMKIFFAIVMAVLNQPSWWVLLPQLSTALISGLLCALMALMLIPIFEHLFNITTDIQLLELSDLSHPLLQSLALNAPGTYHHSLMMASLAQHAAEAIGANGLQLRVCAYFHDIGKLVKPGFFSENIQFSENPHDDLAPSMSTLVIVSHIKEGVILAKKYKLPQVIIDGIEQHQGTSLVTVFYQREKTRQQKENASTHTGSVTVNDEDFRYEGPRPQNREMAILMLADSCEAASRSLEKPSPVRIGNLINDIFGSRLRDGQLDECNLTLAELNLIKKSFIFSLTNMLHGRVAYPKEETKEDRLEAKKQNQLKKTDEDVHSK